VFTEVSTDGGRGARAARRPAGAADRFGGSSASGCLHDDGYSRVEIRTPAGVHDDRTRAGARSERSRDLQPPERQWGGRAARGTRVRPPRQEGPVGDTDTRQPQRGPEVEREPGAAWMVSTGGVRDHNLRLGWKRPQCFLQERAFPEREQPGLVGSAGAAAYDGGSDRPPIARHQHRRCPARLSRAATPTLTAPEADEAAGHERSRLSGPPRGRLHPGELVLCTDELRCRAGPHGAAVSPRWRAQNQPRPPPSRTSGTVCFLFERRQPRPRVTGLHVCVVTSRVGPSRFEIATAAGLTVPLHGRSAGPEARSGAYRLVAVATDAAGNRSAAKRASFKVVRR
jgi:hypothetical protein